MMSSPAGVSEKILLIDDDLALRTALSGSLRRRGFDVVTAIDAREGLYLFREENPAYVVVDFNLGRDASGLEFARDALDERPDVNIVLVTGFATIETAVEAVRLGIKDLLHKPVDGIEILRALGLLATVNTACRKSYPVRLKTMEIDDIKKVMALTGNNVSETARRLGMHRRSLQRKLATYG